MESIEMPVQMTSNVPSSVGGASSFANTASPEIVSFTEHTSILENDQPDSKEVAKDTSSAQRLLDSAKEDGFEETLVRLSEGEFEDKKDETIQDLDDVHEKEIVTKNTDEVIQDELIPFHEQIVLLKEKIESLTEQNRELLERAKSSEKANVANQEIMLALALALYELAKKEENEEQKVSILELIVNMLAYFMKETMTDYSEEEEAKVTPATHSKPRSQAKMDNIVEIMQMIREKGGSLATQQANREAPHIENLAA